MCLCYITKRYDEDSDQIIRGFKKFEYYYGQILSFYDIEGYYKSDKYVFSKKNWNSSDVDSRGKLFPTKTIQCVDQCQEYESGFHFYTNLRDLLLPYFPLMATVYEIEATDIIVEGIGVSANHNVPVVVSKKIKLIRKISNDKLDKFLNDKGGKYIYD